MTLESTSLFMYPQHTVGYKGFAGLTHSLYSCFICDVIDDENISWVMASALLECLYVAECDNLLLLLFSKNDKNLAISLKMAQLYATCDVTSC